MMQREPGKEVGAPSVTRPKWWRDDYTSGWERAKAAIRRDWEQTKHDLTAGRKGADIKQDVGETLKQAAGKPSTTSGQGFFDFDRDEDAIRYGYGASSQYTDYKDWDDTLAAKLKTEWNDLKTGRTWEEIKDAVKYGFRAGRKNIQ
ncbi:MAG: hypothetical protein AB2A00_04950 [Myxococcota bacterium]